MRELLLNEEIHARVIVESKKAFIGSPNLTGAGLGAKHADKRNFEAGFITDEKADLTKLTTWVDDLYRGEFCRRCRLRDRCPDPLDRE